MTEGEAVILGALLHDIGKFGERTGEPLPAWAVGYRQEARYSHEPYSAVFVQEHLGRWPADVTTVRRLVLTHHVPSLPDELLVSLADRLSAYERAEAEGDADGARGRAETAIRTVFSRLFDLGPEAARYHELVELSLERSAVFPRPDAVGSVEAYRALWGKFTGEVTHVPGGDLRTRILVSLSFAKGEWQEGLFFSGWRVSLRTVRRRSWHRPSPPMVTKWNTLSPSSPRGLFASDAE